jgi:putative transposase
LTGPNLGYTISDQTVGNILKRQGILPAPERKTATTWKEFIRTHMDVLVATDFCTAEVWTLGGLVTYDILFFIHLGSRKVHIAGMTPHPHEAWMMQIARNLTMEQWGFLSAGQYLIHDRDGKYCPAFQQIIDTAGWLADKSEACPSTLLRSVYTLFGETVCQGG